MTSNSRLLRAIGIGAGREGGREEHMPHQFFNPDYLVMLASLQRAHSGFSDLSTALQVLLSALELSCLQI